MYSIGIQNNNTNNNNNRSTSTCWELSDSEVRSEIFPQQPEQCSSINADSPAESDSHTITANANKWTDYTPMKAAFRSARNIFSSGYYPAHTAETARLTQL